MSGQEYFPFPMIVNSLSFRPNEPRNGITLVDNSMSVDSEHNRKLMKDAVELYGEYILSAAENGYGRFENWGLFRCACQL